MPDAFDSPQEAEAFLRKIGRIFEPELIRLVVPATEADFLRRPDGFLAQLSDSFPFESKLIWLPGVEGVEVVAGTDNAAFIVAAAQGFSGLEAREKAFVDLLDQKRQALPPPYAPNG